MRPLRRPESGAGREVSNQHLKLRRQVLKGNPLCAICNIEIATEVDHIRPVWLDGRDSIDNCQPACTSCHKAKTAEEHKLRAALKRNPTKIPYNGWREKPSPKRPPPSRLRNNYSFLED